MEVYEKLSELQETIAELEKDNQKLQEELQLMSEIEKEDVREDPKIEEDHKDLVSVESARIVEQSDQYKSLYPDMIEVVIKNNSDETIRSYTVGILGLIKMVTPSRLKGGLISQEALMKFLDRRTMQIFYPEKQGAKTMAGHSLTLTIFTMF